MNAAGPATAAAAQEPAAVGQRPTAAAPPPDQRPHAEAEEREPDRHHRLERQVDHDGVRPVRGRHLLQPLHHRVVSPYASHDSPPGIRIPKHGLLPAGQRDAADRQRRARRSCPTAPSIAASFIGWRSGHQLRRQVPDEHLHRREHQTERQPQRQPAAVVGVAPPLQHPHGVHRRDREAGRHVAGQDHVRRHHGRRRVQHRADRLHVDHLPAGGELEPDRRLHPRVRGDDEPRARRAPEHDRPARTASAPTATADPIRRGRCR